MRKVKISKYMLNLCKRTKRRSENAQLSVEHQLKTVTNRKKTDNGNEERDT